MALSLTDGSGLMATSSNGNGNGNGNGKITPLILTAVIATVITSMVAIVIVSIFAPDNKSAVEQIILIAVPTATSLMAFLQSTRNSAKIDSVHKEVKEVVTNGHDKES